MIDQPIEIKPQPGPQLKFLTSGAQIVIYGGSARGGKTFSLLMEALRHVENPRFKAVIFRDTRPNIMGPGGLYEESSKIYPCKPFCGQFNQTSLKWTFPTKAFIQFHYLRDSGETWKGLWAPLFCFDELTDISEDAFYFLNSRNFAGDSGVAPYIRATCNPDPHSWVKNFIAPWIDPQHEQHAESGEIRWFIRDGGKICWVDANTPHATSMTFIRASIYDNQIFLRDNPDAITKLKALPPAQRARMLYGDWDAVKDGDLFKRNWLPIVPKMPLTKRILTDPKEITAFLKEPPEGARFTRPPRGVMPEYLEFTIPTPLKKVRFWDLAATVAEPGKNPDFTAGVLLGKCPEGNIYVLDVKHLRGSAQTVLKTIEETALKDGKSVPVRVEKEGGASAKILGDWIARGILGGFDFKTEYPKGKKYDRAEPVASFAEQVGIQIIEGGWNADFINEIVAYPTKGVHDDQVDALSGAFRFIHTQRVVTGFEFISF